MMNIRLLRASDNHELGNMTGPGLQVPRVGEVVSMVDPRSGLPPERWVVTDVNWLVMTGAHEQTVGIYLDRRVDS